MENSEAFQEIFKELISEVDCKRSKLPQLLGIEYDVFTKIVEYGRLPKPVILVRIADYFDVSLEYLLGRTPDRCFIRSEENKTFHERYEALKAENGWTDYVIAQKLHVFTSYTTNWRKKKYIPSLNNLLYLSEHFGVTLDYLLGRTEYRD